jgi:Putative phage tail protein
MSGGTIAASGTRAEALTIQSSTEGMCIPWLRGMHRLPGNLLWYGDFRTVSTSEKAGGKGGSPKVEKISYEASFVMGICHGQIHSIPQVWKGKGKTNPFALGLSIFNGALGQGVWSPLLGRGDQSLGYSGLACVGGNRVSLGASAAIENHSFEVRHPSAFGVNAAVPDVDPSTAAYELLTDGTVGASVPPALLGSWSNWSSYCRAADLLMSPVLTTQVTAREALETVADLTNTAIVWSGGVLKMVPYGDQALTANGATYTPNLTPVYELDDSTLLGGNAAPIKRQLKTPADRFNSVSVEFKDRADNYAVTVVTAKDLTDINANGVRAMEVQQAHWITRASVARQVAEVKKQRSLLVLGEYTIRLPWHYALI